MNAVRRTINELSEAIQRIVFNTEFVALNGFLQRINPALKVTGILLLVVFVSLVRDTGKLFIFCFVSFLLAVFSRIPPGFFVKRVLLFVPLFTAFIALPSIFSFVTPGDSILTVFGLHITKQGVNGAATLILRVTASVGLTSLIPLTTKWTDVVYALKKLFVPSSAIVTLLISYRYIFSLIRSAEEMYLARLSRQIKPGLGSHYKALGGKTAIFMRRSMQLSENIYLAFLSRGYDPSTLSGYPRIEVSSSIFGFVWILLIAAAGVFVVL